MKERTTLFNPMATKKKHHHQMRISGGDIGGVLSLGGSLAVAGLVAVFALKTRFGSFRWRRDRVPKKQHNVEQHNDSRIFNSLDPLHKLKPQYLAAIEEEPKSPAIDGSDPPLPRRLNLLLTEQQSSSSVEKLIIWKPLFQRASPGPESLLSPIKEAGEEEHGEYEYEEEDESVSEGEAASAESSSADGEALIWPGEDLEELSRRVKEMNNNSDRPQDDKEMSNS